MKHLLNTIYVTTQGAFLGREGDTVLARMEGERKLQVPIHTIGSIVCFGHVSVSPALMALCAQNSVAVAFFTEHGRFQARVEGPVSGNVLLRRQQYRVTDDAALSAEIARGIVIAKIANCRTVLQRAIRDRPGEETSKCLSESVELLWQHIKDLEGHIALDEIRGKEGDAARRYFAAFDGLITAQKEHFFFHERSRRPPLDNMNALLSFIYTLLVHDVAAALEGVGLDPQVGFLHRDRPGRPGLALDLMEEARPYLADRLALSLVNLREVKGSGFIKTESGGIIMDDTTRKAVLVAYQKRKQEEITHPFLGEKVAIGLLPHIQALLLARHLRGDLDGYPPFFWK